MPELGATGRVVIGDEMYGFSGEIGDYRILRPGRDGGPVGPKDPLYDQLTAAISAAHGKLGPGNTSFEGEIGLED